MLEDVREHPATWTIAASWVLIFLAMQAATYLTRSNQRQDPRPLQTSVIGPGVLSTEVTHLFGDLSFREIRRGEVWRAVTATFIHYSLLHLLMNVFGLIQLGRLIEPWYGAGPFAALCLVLGTLGNLLGTLGRFLVIEARQAVEGTSFWRATPTFVRDWVGPLSSADVRAAGGSTVLLGLMGVALVVGIRSRTRIGSFLANQMWTLLGFTALLGIALPGVVDNFGHGGGALAGVLLGYLHRPLVRRADSTSWRWAGWCLVLVILGAAYVPLGASSVKEFRTRAARDEVQSAADRLREISEVSALLDALGGFYGMVTDRTINSATFRVEEPGMSGPSPVPSPSFPTVPGPQRSPNRPTIDPNFSRALDVLENRMGRIGLGPEVEQDWVRLLGLSRRALTSDLDYRQAYEMVADYREVRRALNQRRAAVAEEVRRRSETLQGRPPGP